MRAMGMRAGIWLVLVVLFNAELGAVPGRTAPREEKITGVEVRGARRVDPAIVTRVIDCRIGDLWQAERARAIEMRVGALHRFQMVIVSTEPFKDGLRVVIAVREAPVLRRIELLGEDPRTGEKPSITPKLRVGEIVVPEVLMQDIGAYRTWFEKRGYLVGVSVDNFAPEFQEKGILQFRPELYRVSSLIYRWSSSRELPGKIGELRDRLRVKQGTIYNHNLLEEDLKVLRDSGSFRSVVPYVDILPKKEPSVRVQIELDAGN